MVNDPNLADIAKAEDAAHARSGFCCSVCKFFCREDLPAIDGECRRNAPVGADTYGRGLWPMVNIIDWCGQGAKS